MAESCGRSPSPPSADVSSSIAAETDAWTRDAVLLSRVTALDPTITYYNGRFWWCAALASGGDGAWAQLDLFHSEALVGPWYAHERNPVVTDCRSLRPAGPPFTFDRVLVRPAQCAVPRYGTAVVFNAVDELSPTSYAERPIGRPDPSAWASAIGVHHVSHTSRRQALLCAGDNAGARDSSRGE
jgi:hypothetical protein